VNVPARRRCHHCCVTLIALALVAGCAAAAPVDGSASRISVVFIEPEKFIDARRAALEPTFPAILRELESFLIDTAARYVPADMKLSIQVTNIDLAGDFELFRGPQADRVRINKGIYPPRIALQFRLADGGDKTIKQGERSLTDLNYQQRAAYPKEDNLRYEKELLRDWLRDEFGALKSKTSQLAPRQRT
jgi:hypothetical protein